MPNSMSLQEFAKKVRRIVLDTIFESQSSHVASCFSIVDILSVLYCKKYVNPELFQFILSKGHGGLALYATLCVAGKIPRDMLHTYCKNGSYLSGHVSKKHVPGVNLSTGSLGGGISVANGVALSNRINNHSHKIYVLIGDGECDEGSIWEACLFTEHRNLKDIVVIVDFNKLQACGSAEKILSLGNIVAKFTSFGFKTFEINGHDYDEIIKALDSKESKPVCIIAHTIKGKGVSFMENDNFWHYRSPNREEYTKALKELM